MLDVRMAGLDVITVSRIAEFATLMSRLTTQFTFLALTSRSGQMDQTARQQRQQPLQLALERQQQRQQRRPPALHHLLNTRVTIAVDPNTTSDAGKETLMIHLADLAVIFAVFQNAELVTMAKKERNPTIIRLSTASRFRIHQEELPRQFLPPQ